MTLGAVLKETHEYKRWVIRALVMLIKSGGEERFRSQGDTQISETPLSPSLLSFWRSVDFCGSGPNYLARDMMEPTLSSLLSAEAVNNAMTQSWPRSAAFPK